MYIVERTSVERLKNIYSTVCLAALIFTLVGAPASAANKVKPEPYNVQTHYSKRETMIAMRDGVKLYTVIYSPKDLSRTYPILLVRTPYSAGPYGPKQFRSINKMAPSERFLRSGYIFVFQDGRGTHNSEGEWINLRPIGSVPGSVDESTDAYDTIDWLIKHLPNNNGRVGQWGISHPGWYTVMGLIGAHPALKAVSPQATTFDPFIGDDDHRNGAFDLFGVDWWYEMSVITGPAHARLGNTPVTPVQQSTAWPYQFFLEAGSVDKLNERYYGGRLGQIWNDLIEHPDYDDFWASRNVDRHLANVRIPVLNVMGWFDAYDPYGAMATYHAIEAKNPHNDSVVVAGPWGHGQWLSSDGSKDGDIEFGAKTAEYYKENLVYPFFQFYLKNQGHWSPAEATMFETGENRWHHFDQWPPKSVTPTNLYIDNGKKLSLKVPEHHAADSDSYVSDPSHPVPFTPYIPGDPDDQTYLTADQRFASSRSDVLTYQTSVLTEDLTIAGPIPIDLYVSTTGTDSDWFVKLIDVYPENIPDERPSAHGRSMEGYQMLLGEEVMRGKYRNSFSAAEPMTPGEVTRIGFEIRDKFHRFKKGHRVMVQIQSTWFPKVDRNPQTFTNIYRATATEYQSAVQKIYRFGEYPSHIVLPVIPPTQD